jgi:Zn-dependent protease
LNTSPLPLPRRHPHLAITLSFPLDPDRDFDLAFDALGRERISRQRTKTRRARVDLLLAARLLSARMGSEVLLVLPVLLFSVVFHEYAHGWMARREGDNTAAMLGRLTLNPIPHIDLFGSIILPLLLVLSRSGIFFAWAKPVPTNPRNYRNYRRGTFLVAIAGVTVNLILAVILTLVTILLIHLTRMIPTLSVPLDILRRMVHIGIFVNLVLAFFNLIPVPPLDGSHILYLLLPPRLGMQYRSIGFMGIFIVILLMNFAPVFLAPWFVPMEYLRNLSETVIRLWT